MNKSQTKAINLSISDLFLEGIKESITQLYGNFVNYDSYLRELYLKFDSGEMLLFGFTFSEEMAQELVNIFNGKKQTIHLQDDGWKDQRTGQYMLYIDDCVIEKGKHPETYMGELIIFMASNNMIKEEKTKICNAVIEILNH